MRIPILFFVLLVLFAALGYFGYTYSSGNWLLFAGILIISYPCLFAALVIRFEVLKPGTALVRTCKSKTKVAISGGLWMNLIVHKIREIPLNRHEIKIVLESEESCLTYDFNRCDIEVALYVKIASDEEDILKASQAFEEKLIISETLEELVEPKVIHILKEVVAATDSPDLIRRRQKIVEKVHEKCKEELKLHFGLTLEKSAIRRVYFHPIDWSEGRIDTAPVNYPTEIAQITRCGFCNNEGAKVFLMPQCFGKGETLLVVEDVPVIFCRNCRENYLSRDTLKEIEHIKRDREKVAPKRPVSVAVFK